MFAALSNVADVYNMNLPSVDISVAHLSSLVPWQNAPKSNNNDLWFDFCGHRMWKLVKFTKKWHFNMAITVWARGRFTDGWKDSKSFCMGIILANEHMPRNTSEIIVPASVSIGTYWFQGRLLCSVQIFLGMNINSAWRLLISDAV